jgi:biotin carboxyl carrier protein
MIRFRDKALARHREADGLDDLMRVARPRAWLGAAALTLAVAALLVFGFAGSIPQTVESPGVVAGASGVRQVESTLTVEVQRVSARIGDQVERGDEVIKVIDDRGRKLDFVSPVDGEIVALDAKPGSVVEPGGNLFTLEEPRPGGEGLVAYLFLDPEEAGPVFPGMPATLETINFGVLEGEVSQVDNAPASSTELEGIVGNDLLVDRFSANPPVVARIVVDGAVSPRLSTGALVDGTITLQDRRPIDVIFG